MRKKKLRAKKKNNAKKNREIKLLVSIRYFLCDLGFLKIFIVQGPFVEKWPYPFARGACDTQLSRYE